MLVWLTTELPYIQTKCVTSKQQKFHLYSHIYVKNKKKAKNEEYLEGETARRMSLKCYKVYREVESEIFFGELALVYFKFGAIWRDPPSRPKKYKKLHLF